MIDVSCKYTHILLELNHIRMSTLLAICEILSFSSNEERLLYLLHTLAKDSEQTLSVLGPVCELDQKEELI